MIPDISSGEPNWSLLSVNEEVTEFLGSTIAGLSLQVNSSNNKDAWTIHLMGDLGQVKPALVVVS